MELKRIFVLLLLCSMVMTTFVFAAEGDDPETGETGSEPEVTETETSSGDEVIPEETPAEEETETETETEVVTETEDETEILEESSSSSSSSSGSFNDYMVYTIDDGSSDSGIKVILIDMFGEYVPKTQAVERYSADGTIISYVEYVPGLAGVDWPWVASVGLFALVLYSFFRILGVFFRGR